jgi:YTH domain-containing family protein
MLLLMYSKFTSTIVPRLQNLHSYSSGLGPYSGYPNGMYPSNMMYSQYGNTYRGRSNYGSTYGSRTGSYDNKYRSTRYGSGFDHVKRNADGFGELNKGPRGSNSSDDKNDKSLGPVTLLLKGQDLPIKSDDDKEVLPVPDKQQYTGEYLSENYSDAKFFVIKSYSEDDIHKSMKYNVWTITPNGNKKLDAAYQEAKEKSADFPIFLLFSVS